MRRIAVACVFILSTALPAAGVLQFGTAEFQVNTYTSDFQDDPAVCAAGNGTFVVVWESEEQDGFADGVFGQRYDSAGIPLGGEFQVNSYTFGGEIDPDVCCYTDGSFVVVWHGSQQDGDDDGVFGQRFSSSGAPAGPQFQVNTYTTSYQANASVCCADTSFVVVWDSAEQEGSGDGVFGQRFSSSGSPLGGEFQVNTYTSDSQDYAAVCCAPDGAFVVAWESSEQDGLLEGVFGQRFSASGAPAGPEFQVNAYTSSSQEDVAVCCAADGAFAVAWESSEQDGSSDGVFAQRFGSFGAPQGANFQVNTYTLQGQEDPTICCGENGFVVAWESDEQDGDADGIYAQEYDGSGIAVGGEFQVHAYTSASQDDAAVACAPGGEVLVVWEGGDDAADQDGSQTGVFARLLVEPLTILEIPALGPAGLAALAGLLGFGAIVALRRR